MKKTKLLLTTFFIAACALSASSQENTKDPNPVYRNGGFWDHWYISAGVGGQMYFGEDDNKAEIKDRITPSFQLSAGKWITHFFGSRIQVGGMQLKGWNDGIDGSYRTEDPSAYPSGLTIYDPQMNRPDRTWVRAKDQRYTLPNWDPAKAEHGGDYNGGYGDLYLQDMKYFDVHVDFMFNIISAIRGYSSTRLFNLIPYAGVGFAYTPGDDYLVSDYSFMPVAGIMFDFRLSKAWNLGLDIKGTVVQESFDSHVGGETATNYWTQEGYASAVLAVSYKFKQREFEKVYEMDPNEVQQLNDRINALLIPAPIPVCPECPAVVEAPREKIYLAPVHFPLDVHLVQAKEMYKVELAAKFLTDDSSRSLHLEGFADRKTGNRQYNQGISERRVREVRRLLVEKYGIAPGRLTIGWQGDLKQPFDVNDLNRAVLFIGDDESLGKVDGTGGTYYNPGPAKTKTTSKVSDTEDGNLYK